MNTKINKKAIKVVLSILLLTSFYNAKSMQFSPLSLATPFAKIINIGSKFLSEEYQSLLKKCRLFYCNKLYRFYSYGITTHEYIQKLIEYGYIEEAKNVINTPRRDFIEKDCGVVSYEKTDRTPLEFAIENKNLELAKLCLPYCTENTINKALDKALDFGPNLDFIKLLLQYCSAEDTISKTLDKALDFSPNLDFIKLLLQYSTKDIIDKLKPKLSKLCSELYHRTCYNLDAKLELLKTNLNFVERMREMPKYIPVENNNKEIEFLRKLDADLCSQDNNESCDSAETQATKINNPQNGYAVPYIVKFLQKHERYSNEIKNLEDENRALIEHDEILRKEFVDLSKEIKDIQEVLANRKNEIKKQLRLIN